MDTRNKNDLKNFQKNGPNSSQNSKKKRVSVEISDSVDLEEGKILKKLKLSDLINDFEEDDFFQWSKAYQTLILMILIKKKVR